MQIEGDVRSGLTNNDTGVILSDTFRKPEGVFSVIILISHIRVPANTELFLRSG